MAEGAGIIAQADRPQRELERIRQYSIELHNQASDALARLEQLRSRLLGEGEGKPDNAGREDAPKAVQSELADLMEGLEALGETLSRIDHNISRLESI